MSSPMEASHKVLLLDDDEAVIEIYRDLLRRIACQPEVHVVTSGPRAITMLESDVFTLLIADLRMPRMDGLQVLTVVRRKFPQLRTIVLTAMDDEQFRCRAYALGTDLYLLKPSNQREMQFFLDCVQSLLQRQSMPGFHGVQSKSLVDLIQLECLSLNSSVLRITRGDCQGHIWFESGELLDAEAEGKTGAEAFQRILSWKTGRFEILPPEPKRERRIFNSYQGLLLEAAHAMDEAEARQTEAGSAPAAPAGMESGRLKGISRLAGVEFALVCPLNGVAKTESWRVEEPEQLGDWARSMARRFATLGEKLKVGGLQKWTAQGAVGRVSISLRGEEAWCVAYDPVTVSPEQIRNSIQRNEV